MNPQSSAPFTEPESSQKDTTVGSSSKKLKTPKIFWVITALFVLLVVGLGYLFATKQLVLALGATDKDVVTVVSRACTKATIKTYNDANSSEAGDTRAAALKNAFEAVNKTAGYAGDPNCIYIRYTYYIEQKDTANAQKEVDTLNSLAKKNLYATSELTLVQPIESMQRTIDILKLPEGQTPTGEADSGGRG